MVSVNADEVIRRISERSATAIADLLRQVALAEVRIEYLEKENKGLAARNDTVQELPHS